MRERKSPILLKTIWEKRREENVTAMMAIRREIIDIVGKFGPFFNVRGEDRDFLLRVKMHNIPLVFNKTAIVFHKKKSFKPRDYWRMRIPRARASIKFGLYVWRDTAAVVFYFLSLVQLLVLWLIGELLLGLFLFTQLLLSRIRNSLKFFRDKEYERLVTAILYAYIAYTAFIADFIRYYSSNFGYFLIRKNQKKSEAYYKSVTRSSYK